MEVIVFYTATSALPNFFQYGEFPSQNLKIFLDVVKAVECRYLCLSNHFDHFASIYHPGEAMGTKRRIRGRATGQKLIPPAKEKVTCDELEPRRERFLCGVGVGECEAPLGISRTPVVEHGLEFFP